MLKELQEEIRFDDEETILNAVIKPVVFCSIRYMSIARLVMI